MNIEAYIKIIRPIVCIQLGILSLVGMILAGNGHPEPTTSIQLFISAFLIAASIHTLNDYLDYQVDSVNTPWRPIPSGKISRTAALQYGIALGALGLVITLLFNLTATLLGLTILALTNYYSIKGKVFGFIGHLIVASTFSAFFLFGALTVTNQIKPYLWNIGALAFLYILGGEVIQSIADAEGDKLRGVKSIAITNSPRTAAIVALICNILMTLLGVYTMSQFGVSIEASSTIIIVAATLLFICVINLPLLQMPEKRIAIKTRIRLNTFGLIMILAFMAYLLV
jgi:geranylgeranylglycerol-phosphate geranylgeranyltransferase